MKRTLDSINDELRGESGEQDSQQARNHDIAGAAQDAGKPVGKQKRKSRRDRYDDDDADERRNHMALPPVRLASSSVAVIAPGPAISGIASGKAARSATLSRAAV